MSSTVSRATFNEDNTWRTNTFLFNDYHCGETLREAITTMCQQKGYPSDLILQNVTEAGAACTLFRTKFGKETPWPFAIDSDYKCSLGRQVEIEATKVFEVAKGLMDNEDALVGLCNTAVTKKMKEVKEVSLHLPYRRFRKASLLLASGTFLAEAQLHPSTIIGKIYGQWLHGEEALRTNRFIACMGARIMATQQLRWQQPRNSAASGVTPEHPRGP